MNAWTRDAALKWADTWGPMDGDEFLTGDAQALDALAREVRRLHGRVERLRGLCKSCSGWLLDAGDVENSTVVLALVGDMEKPLP